MKPGECYEQALAKHERAEKHIGDLQAALDRLREVDPCSIGIKQNPETGDITYYVMHVPIIPREVSLIIGDALQGFRCALDYVACGVVVAGGGKVTSKTKFPIVKDPADWEVSGLRMVDGAHQFAIEALRRLKPYEGGNLPLWLLHRLNNIDKHRLLLAVCLINSGRTIGPNEEATQLQGTGEEFFVDTSHGRARFRVRAVPPVPLYEGQELLTVPLANADKKMGFFVEVASGESGLAEGTPILFLLKWISSEVSLIVGNFARFLP
jgi:hypothetical protein